MIAATFFDGEEWRHGSIGLDALGAPTLRDEPAPAGAPALDGVVIGGFTDHHVHLQLVDATRLDRGLLGRVVDLGGAVEVLSRLAAVYNSGRTPAATSEGAENGSSDTVLPGIRPAVEVEFAGAFLTPPGGYPSDRDWAPPGSVREIAGPHDAEAAVADMTDAGATRIKVAANSTAGPVFDDEMLRTIVTLAARHRVPVVMHAEGRGQAQRAAALGVHALAHAPFTERLGDDEIAAQAASVAWISTLAIHGGADLHIASDNVRRFHRAGGILLYGTDMGNGPAPVDLNPQELAALRAAGVGGTDLLRALRPVDPLDPASVLLLLPATDADPTTARRLTADDLKV